MPSDSKIQQLIFWPQLPKASFSIMEELEKANKVDRTFGQHGNRTTWICSNFFFLALKNLLKRFPFIMTCMDHYLAKKFPLILICEHKELCAKIKRYKKIKPIHLLMIKVGAEFSWKPTNKSCHQNWMSWENTSLIDLPRVSGFQVHGLWFWAAKIFLKLFNVENWAVNSRLIVSSHGAACLIAFCTGVSQLPLSCI